MPSLIANIKTAGQYIAGLLFPINCIVCKKYDVFLCPQCAFKLPRLANQACLVCQKPSPFGKTHAECGSKNKVDGIISALPYKDPKIKALIEVFKYNFVSDLSKPLATLIVGEIKNNSLTEYFNNFTIIPVPLHRRRFVWRGFNQAELLSEVLAQELGAKWDLNAVMRHKNTVPQIRLGANERKTNIQNAFTGLKDFTNQKIIIVDDVATTGSTINEIARILKKNGASEVWSLTVARD